MILKIPAKGLLILLFSCLFTLLLNSCQKEEMFGHDPKLKLQATLLGESRVFFEQNILRQEQRLQARPKALRHRVAKVPVWDQAQKVQLSIGEGLKVPLAYSEEMNLLIGPNKVAIPLAELSYLLLYKDRQQQWKAEVVTRIPDDTYWAHRHELNRSFSGIIIVEDWWGRPIKTFQKTPQQKYMMLSNLVLGARPKEKEPQNLQTPNMDCIVVVTLDEKRMYNVEYTCHEHPGGDGDNDEGDGGGFGDGGFGDNGGGGGGNGPRHGDYEEHPRGGGGGGRRNDNPPPPDRRSDIINNLPEGCLKKVVDELIQKDCKNELSSMINQVFNVSPELDLVIDGRSTFSNDIDADAATQLGHDGYCKINIDLNINVLLGAAKEYIAATMFHESIHAYLAATSRMSDLDHQVMADLYISKMIEGIQELHPSISSADAEALAWGGLQETAVWSELLISDPVKANLIRQTNNNFRNGDVGNTCD